MYILIREFVIFPFLLLLFKEVVMMKKQSKYHMINYTAEVTNCHIYCEGNGCKIDFYRNLEAFILEKPSYILFLYGQTVYEYTIEGDLKHAWGF